MGAAARARKIASDWDARIWIDGVGEAERRFEVTPAIAGWDLLSCRSYTFRAGQVIDGESATDEMAMVLLSGSVTIEAANAAGGWRETWVCDGRESVFDGAPFAIYLPPGHTYRTTVHRDADCVYGRAPATGAKPPRLIRPDEATVEEGDGRRVTHILGPMETERLRCRETILQPGVWGWPAPPDEPAQVEQVIHYRMQAADGWAMQRLPGGGEPDQAVIVEQGDAVIVSHGPYPIIGAPGVTIYALSYLAS